MIAFSLSPCCCCCCNIRCSCCCGCCWLGRTMQILTSSCHKRQPNERCKYSQGCLCCHCPLPLPLPLCQSLSLFLPLSLFLSPLAPVSLSCPLLPAPCCVCNSEIVQLHQAKAGKDGSRKRNALTECAACCECVCLCVCVWQACAASSPHSFLTWLCCCCCCCCTSGLAFVPFLQHKTERPRGQHTAENREREPEGKGIYKHFS